MIAPHRENRKRPPTPCGPPLAAAADGRRSSGAKRPQIAPSALKSSNGYGLAAKLPPTGERRASARSRTSLVSCTLVASLSYSDAIYETASN